MMPGREDVLREVRSLPAGREMDREIGEQIMGLSSGSNPPPYSSGITAAWSVVEKMVRSDDMYFSAPHYKARRQSLGPLGYPVGTECWYCVLNNKTFNKVVICADTAPLAICRAALVCIRSIVPAELKNQASVSRLP
jgi:hypothetical protein